MYVIRDFERQLKSTTFNRLSICRLEDSCRETMCDRPTILYFREVRWHNRIKRPRFNL